MAMWANTNNRALLSARCRFMQLGHQTRYSINNVNFLAKSPLRRTFAGAAMVRNSAAGNERWQWNAGGDGGGGGYQSGHFRRFWKKNGEFVPLSWLVIATWSTVEFALQAYTVETQDFTLLVERCNFQVSAAAAGDEADLSSLYDLLDWVCYSAEQAGPTTLPKLLDADVIGVVLKGVESPNPDVSTLCHRILHALSSNEHVAAMMAKDPNIRTALVGEVRRQILRNPPPPESGDSSSAFQTPLAAKHQMHDLTTHDLTTHDLTTHDLAPHNDAKPYQYGQIPREGDHVTSASSARYASRQRVSEDQVEGNVGRSEYSKVGNEAFGREERGELGGLGDGKEHIEVVDGSFSQQPNAAGGAESGSTEFIVFDPFYAAVTICTLRNIMRGSRNINGIPLSVADLVHSSANYGWIRTLNPPWPVQLLYGENNYGYGEVEGGEEEAVEWPLEQKLLTDIADIMMSVSRRTIVKGSILPQERWNCVHLELDDEEQMTMRQALQELEAAAASLLREASGHPQLVENLMRRRPMIALTILSWKGQSAKAEDCAAEAMLNVCAAYWKMYGRPPTSEFTTSSISSMSEWTSVTAWMERTLADETAGTFPSALDASQEDQEFVVKAEFATPPLALSGPLPIVTASAIAGVAGFGWGIARRWAAWRRAGEMFAAVARFSLPRALLWAGLRAGLGAMVLTATHGPVGFRSQMTYKTLDATTGDRGTLTMSGARQAVDLGYLYVILRLCPYSLFPAVVLNSMLELDHGASEFGAFS